MAERKTLHITVTAGPYGNESPVSVFRMVDAALSKGCNVNVLAYEDAVLLTAKAQKQHDDPIWKDKVEHHTDAGKAHSTTAEFVERLLEKGKDDPKLNWYV
jgi:sulfur relay (sulfurtransferase) complex TusBCD TusD component (DsrE family)